ncbi:MAG: hypothetical protein ACYDAE_21385 [Steroidobacteraceae bacterium]
MKVFNLTDVETAALEQRGLVRHTFVLGKTTIAPGQSAQVDPACLDRKRVGVQELVALGALAVGECPPSAYVVAKARSATPTVSKAKKARS